MDETSLSKILSELEKMAKSLDELKTENSLLRVKISEVEKSSNSNSDNCLDFIKEEKLDESEDEIQFDMREIKEKIETGRRDRNDVHEGQVATESTSELNTTGLIAEDAPKWTIEEADGVQRYKDTARINENWASGKVSLEGISQRINALEAAGVLGQQKIAFIQDNVESLWAVTGSTGCGGNVKVAPGMPAAIRYPNGGNYSNNERCAWSIISTPKTTFKSYRIKVDSFSMEEGSDGVNLYYWDFTGELQSQKITRFGEWILIEAPNLVMTFGSDGANVGEGFYATIAGVGTLSSHPAYKSIRLYNPKKTYSYPVGSDTAASMEMRVVVQHRPDLSRAVTLSSHIASGDSIMLYELTCNHKYSANYELIQRKSGAEGRGIGFRKSANPVLVIFRRKSKSWLKIYFEK